MTNCCICKTWLSRLKTIIVVGFAPASYPFSLTGRLCCLPPHVSLFATFCHHQVYVSTTAPVTLRQSSSNCHQLSLTGKLRSEVILRPTIWIQEKNAVSIYWIQLIQFPHNRLKGGGGDWIGDIFTMFYEVTVSKEDEVCLHNKRYYTESSVVKMTWPYNWSRSLMAELGLLNADRGYCKWCLLIYVGLDLQHKTLYWDCPIFPWHYKYLHSADKGSWL